MDSAVMLWMRPRLLHISLLAEHHLSQLMVHKTNCEWPTGSPCTDTLWLLEMSMRPILSIETLPQAVSKEITPVLLYNRFLVSCKQSGSVHPFPQSASTRTSLSDTPGFVNSQLFCSCTSGFRGSYFRRFSLACCC